MVSVSIGRAQTKSRHYGSSLDNQLNGTRHYTSTSLIMRKHLTVWIGEHYRNFFDTMEYMGNSYNELHYKVVHRGQLTDAFQVKTGVTQGCLLSLFLFIFRANRMVKTLTSEGKHEIQWTARKLLEDLDFSDYLVLLSHTHQQMQIKTTSVATASAS
ncbi:unnamed protein product [Schistosoma margrebowiei]|uniref:Uncharacterized protein n=1 Tax=Schistosoma margrebowiei TaxID=48269 RepID=A0A183NBD6_9TREM|nr:unnamed protein product [Schistosoma margrebowiei]